MKILVSRIAAIFANANLSISATRARQQRKVRVLVALPLKYTGYMTAPGLPYFFPNLFPNPYFLQDFSL
jgi:hypothetical protein